MKALSSALLTGHDSAQLNRKAIVTPKAFSFHQKKNIHHLISSLISLPDLKVIAANLKKHPR